MLWTINNTSFALRKFVILTTTLWFVWQLNLVLAAKRAPSLQQKLQRKVSVTWQGQELALALERLARAGEIELWIDRKVDRQKIISVEIADLTFAQAFQKLCQDHSLGFEKLNNLVYVGPKPTANQLRTLLVGASEPLSELSTGLRKRWEKPKPVEWPRLSEPRQLSETWLREANLQLNGDERIPHDLWAKQTLPPISLVDRLVITLAGFDLTCQIATDGKSCEVVPIQSLPSDSQRTVVDVALPPATKQRSANRKSRQVFTLRLENQPLGRVLDKFSEQLGLEIDWPDSVARSAREQLVSCEVSEANLDELLRAVLSGAKLRHRREGKRVTIDVER